MQLLNFSSVGKARKPRFELHLKIYDLNNVPLVSGSSFVKWHLSHSMHAEHRGRTNKSPIANHRVDYSYVVLAPSIRISVDRANQLAECPLELEVVQEFGVTEKMTLGYVRLNLSEYVEESEAFGRDLGSPVRRRSNSVTMSPTSTTTTATSSATARRSSRDTDIVQEGIVRRYLMQDSKVNSTLKLGILMIQVDGERNFIAPALKTAPVFGGIAGLMGEHVEEDVGPVPSISKPRDAAELQDLYRRTLAASWCRQPNELPADECIEDIFGGGNGWKTRPEGGGSSTLDSDDEDDFADDDSEARDGTLRPRDARRFGSHLHSSHPIQPQNHQPQHHHHHHHHHHHGHQRHRRTASGGSDRSVSTMTVTPARPGSSSSRRVGLVPANDDAADHLAHSRSLASLAATMGGGDLGRGGDAYRRAKELGETDLRDDLVAWRLPGGLTAGGQ